MGPTTLDCRELRCPMPIVQVAIAIRDLAVGAELAVQATDPAFLADIRAWARMTGHELAEVVDGPIKHVVVRKTQ